MLMTFYNSRFLLPTISSARESTALLAPTGGRKPLCNSTSKPMSRTAPSSQLPARTETTQPSASSTKKPSSTTRALSAKSSSARTRTSGCFRAPRSMVPSTSPAFLPSLPVRQGLFGSITKEPTGFSQSRSGMPIEGTGSSVSLTRHC